MGKIDSFVFGSCECAFVGGVLRLVFCICVGSVVSCSFVDSDVDSSTATERGIAVESVSEYSLTEAVGYSLGWNVGIVVGFRLGFFVGSIPIRFESSVPKQIEEFNNIATIVTCNCIDSPGSPMLIEMSSMKNEKLLCSVSRQSCKGLSMKEDVSHQNRRMF